MPDRVLGGSGYGSSGGSQYNEQFTIWAVSTAGANKGQVLFNISPKPPAANVTLQFEGSMVNKAALDAGVFVVRAKETRQWIGFDINTGKQLWITEPQNEWMMYSRTCSIADGTLYTGGYGGILYAYDIRTGELLWQATTDPCNLDGPYDRYPIGATYAVDGKVFAITSEHSLTQPYYKGWSMYCFDNKTGERLWDMPGFWKIGAFADGYWATQNAFDMSVYVFGKGPSQTTVSIQNDVAYGDSVSIKGSVLDISAGTKTSDIAPRFPNGVPAIADANMTAWMEYVYQQRLPKPTDVKGVPVTIDVVDANGNYRNIGNTTSDANGFYSIAWKPDIEGKYTVFATFGGSESYWPSTAQTAFVAQAPPGATATPIPAAQSVADQYFVPAIIGIIVTIILVGAVIVLLTLRKRQ